MTLPAPLRRNLLLLVVCLAQLMVVLDVSIVTVALPSIRHDLGYTTTGLQWVVNAYTLTFAGFLMLGGRAADLLGRRRVFLAGTGPFTLASLVCAAEHAGTLDGARALQGFGAAIISPATLAILTTSFSEGRERQPRAGRVAPWAASAAPPASCSAPAHPRAGLARDLPHQPAHRPRGHPPRAARRAFEGRAALEHRY
jgi:MFS family permease